MRRRSLEKCGLTGRVRRRLSKTKQWNIWTEYAAVIQAQDYCSAHVQARWRSIVVDVTRADINIDDDDDDSDNDFY